MCLMQYFFGIQKRSSCFIFVFTWFECVLSIKRAKCLKKNFELSYQVQNTPLEELEKYNKWKKPNQNKISHILKKKKIKQQQPPTKKTPKINKKPQNNTKPQKPQTTKTPQRIKKAWKQIKQRRIYQMVKAAVMAELFLSVF